MKSSKLSKWAILALLSMSPVSAHAAEKWTGWRGITHVYPHPSGFNIFLDGAPIGSACGGVRFIVRATDPNYEVTVSTLLTAFTGQMSVNLVYDDTTLNDCDVTMKRVQVVRAQ